MRRRWSDQRRLFLPTRNRPHGRETFPGTVVDFKSLHVERGGLLDDMLGALPTPHGPLCDAIAITVDPMAGHAESRQAMGWKQQGRAAHSGTKVSKLTQSDAIRLVEGLEQRLSKGSYTIRTSSDYVAVFKTYIAAAFDRQGKILRFPSGPSIHAARENRGLLSDQPDAFANSIQRIAPPSSMSHGAHRRNPERRRQHILKIGSRVCMRHAMRKSTRF